MGSAWTDLDRPPLSAPSLTRALGNGLWRDITVVPSTGSTNADVAVAARAGSAEGLVAIAEEQVAGRGRLDRSWQAPPRSSVLMSLLLRPAVEPARLPLIPLLAGVAVAEAVRAVGRVDAVLKWPNDVLVGERKLAGLLVERVDEAVVVGIGINVSVRAEELPVPTATSVLLEGGRPDRESLVKETLRAFERRYAGWLATAGAAASVLPAYREICSTVGANVAVRMPDGTVETGMAEAVDDEGRLVVRRDDGERRHYLAGDVEHVRLFG